MRVVSDSYRLYSFGKVAKGIPDLNKYSSYITHVLLVSLSSSGTPVGFCVLCQLGVKSTFSDFCDRCAKDLPSRHKLRSVFTPDMRGTPKMGATRSNKGGALSSSQGGGGATTRRGARVQVLLRRRWARWMYGIRWVSVISLVPPTGRLYHALYSSTCCAAE